MIMEKTFVQMSAEDLAVGLTRWNEAEKKTELLRHYDILNDNIQDVPCDMFAELENTFGCYAMGNTFTEEELDAKHYGHSWRELIRLICEENTRRRVYGVETAHSNHEEGTPCTKKYFDSLKKIVANPNVQIHIIKTAPESNREKAERLYKEGSISETTYKGLIASFKSWEQQGGDVPIREITDIHSYKNANGELCYDWTERIIV